MLTIYLIPIMADPRQALYFYMEEL
jgi:hypothetical protein